MIKLGASITFDGTNCEEEKHRFTFITSSEFHETLNFTQLIQ